MIGGDLLPDGQGGVLLAKGRQCFRQSHQRIPIIVLGIFRAHALQERPGFGGSFGAQQTLAEMSAGVDVLGIAFERGTIAGFRLFKFTLLKIDVTKVEVVDPIIEMVDFGLKFLDAFALFAPRAVQTRACWRASRGRCKRNTRCRGPAKMRTAQRYSLRRTASMNIQAWKRRIRRRPRI